MNEPNEPLRVAYTREEMMQRMNDWMTEQWGNPKDLPESQQNTWLERNGLLAWFIREHFPENTP